MSTPKIIAFLAITILAGIFAAVGLAINLEGLVYAGGLILIAVLLATLPSTSCWEDKGDE